MIHLFHFILFFFFNFCIESMACSAKITNKSLKLITCEDLKNVTLKSTYKSLKGFPLLDLETMGKKSLLKEYVKNEDIKNEVLSTLIFINSFLPEVRNIIISHLFSDEYGMYAVPIFLHKPLVHVLNTYTNIRRYDGYVATTSFIKQFTYAKIELRNFFCREKKTPGSLPLITTDKKHTSRLDIFRYKSDIPLAIGTCPITYKYKCKNYSEVRKKQITISSIPGLLGRTDIIISGLDQPDDIFNEANSELDSTVLTDKPSDTQENMYQSWHCCDQEKTNRSLRHGGDFDFFAKKKIDNGYFFGLYAGHDGKKVVDFLDNHFHNSFKSATGTISQKITAACMHINETNADDAGSSLGVVFIKDNIIHCAHLGICRIFIKNENGIIALTQDHTSQNNNEVERIKQTSEYTGRGARFYADLAYYAKNVYEENRTITCVTRSIGEPKMCQLSLIPQPEYCSCVQDKNSYVIITANSVRKEDIPSIEEEALSLEKLFNEDEKRTIEELAKSFNKSWTTNRAIMIIDLNTREMGDIDDGEEKIVDPLEPDAKFIEVKPDAKFIEVKPDARFIEEEPKAIEDRQMLWSNIKKWIGSSAFIYPVATLSLIAALFYLFKQEPDSLVSF